MPINLIPEEDLRTALRIRRVEPQRFEAGVRERIEVIQAQSESDLFVRLSPLARAAAALLPLEALAGCQTLPAATKAAPAGGIAKLLSYLTFPAVSVFALLGATIFSFAKIRSIQGENTSGTTDQRAAQESIYRWWQQHRLAGWAVFSVSLVLMFIGASSLLFLFYLISLGLLVYVLSAFAKVGVGSRDVVGRICGMGLIFLGQASGSADIGSREIHLLDQGLIGAIFFLGVLLLLPCQVFGPQTTTIKHETPPPTSRWFWAFYAGFVLLQLGFIGWFWSLPRMSFQGRMIISGCLAVGIVAPVFGIWYSRWLLKLRLQSQLKLAPIVFALVLLIPLTAWHGRSLLWPVTPERIKSHVESFDLARFSSASWANWEIPARWTIDAQLQPDLSKPRQLLATELKGEQNPYVLSTAMQVGLILPDQLGQLKNYDQKRRHLFAETPGIHPLAAHLGQYDWVVRTAVLKDDLSSAERDMLERQLLAIFEGLPSDEHAKLETAHEATQLLAVIGRPVNADQYRAQIHELLHTFHHTSGGWGQVNGGFRSYKKIAAGNLNATAHAVELMKVFGAPDDLNLLWIRSFLSNGRYKIGDEKWIAAATLERFNKLPNAPHPTWFDYLYYERTLLAAIALVALCLYATYSSPSRKTDVPANQPCPA